MPETAEGDTETCPASPDTYPASRKFSAEGIQQTLKPTAYPTCRYER